MEGLEICFLKNKSRFANTHPEQTNGTVTSVIN